MRVCDRDCFNCPFEDCVVDGYNYKEKLKQDHFDNDLKPHDQMYQYNHKPQSIENRKAYEKSAKGKERAQRYNNSEKGKERFRRYYQRKQARLKGVAI